MATDPVIAVTSEPAPRPGLASRTFDSLRVHDFRWFYISMLAFTATMNMQQVVRGTLAFTLTGSFVALGLVAVVGAVPQIVLLPVGGVVADRLPKRLLLQAGQAIGLCNAVTMALLVFLGLMRIEWLLVSAFVHSCAMSLTLPARQAIISEIVRRDQLMNAVSLNMSAMNTMQLVAPALAGVVIGVAGFGWAFLTMATLYGVGVIALSRIGDRGASVPAADGLRLMAHVTSALGDIREGWRYIWRDAVLRSVILLTFVSSFLGMTYVMLLPGYVAGVFGGGGLEVGVIMSVSALGSISAALALSSRGERRRGAVMLAGTVVLGTALFAFTRADALWIAALVMVVVGLGSTLRMTAGQGLLQSRVEGPYRGRVFAVYLMQGPVQLFGTFLFGFVAESAGIRTLFAGLGVALVVATLCAYVLVPSVRRAH